MNKILVLGGTGFVGRHLVNSALARGHAVTLFNRGRRNPGLFPDAEHLVGDRDGGLGVLADGRWDAVIDTSGYFPRLVRDSASALADRVGRYAFVSTISVYDDPVAGADETAPLRTIEDPSVEEVTGETYGALKVLCERAVEAIYGDRCLIVRPGIIAGPHDPTDRFTHWARAMAGPGPVIAPLPAEAPVQVIDARDLADWTIRMVETGASGTYNTVGPAEPVARGAFLEALRPPGGTARVVWVDAERVEAEGLEPGKDFPLWTAPEDAGIFGISAAKARGAGLTLRPLAETARDTVAWLAAEPARALKFDMAPEVVARLSR
ncbi:MAG: NAD-dependent epimerase/dehydratase family protein [Candidatus Sericytochromatia bacterium]